MSPKPAKPKRGLPLGPLLLSVAIGGLAGAGAFTFRYAEGFSYFKTDPAACANCHIMQSQYDSWQKASHHTSAVCVDCHLPDAFVPKYLAKAENGWRHGKLFTTGGFKEPIVVQEAGARILQDNCERCHSSMTADMRSQEAAAVLTGRANDRTPSGHGNQELPCVHCHSTVGHGPRAGLGGPSTPTEDLAP